MGGDGHVDFNEFLHYMTAVFECIGEAKFLRFETLLPQEFKSKMDPARVEGEAKHEKGGSGAPVRKSVKQKRSLKPKKEDPDDDDDDLPPGWKKDKAAGHFIAPDGATVFGYQEMLNYDYELQDEKKEKKKKSVKKHAFHAMEA